MDLTDYRASSAEQQRTADLLRLMPASGRTALDIGARDGHFSRLMAERFEHVTALDLTRPDIAHPRIDCVEGNAANMAFDDGAFDFVFCAEVLEHVPTAILSEVCREIQRVAKDRIVIGVPYKQDIRVGRTTCYSCGEKNPPWGHVNAFDEARLQKLFPACQVMEVSLIGQNTSQTNALSTWLMDLAGNPYGTYEQEEGCVRCGQRLRAPPRRSAAQRVATKLAFWARRATDLTARPRSNWIHIVFSKGASASAPAAGVP